MKKILVVGIVLLFLGSSVPVLAQTKEHSRPLSHILYVGGTGSGNYSKIQDAIDNASNGDTVFVFHGTYYENVVINTTINLIGENKNTTIIDGKRISNVVVLNVDNIKISNFAMQNCSWHYYYYTPEIKLLSNNSTISNNIIFTKSDLNYGITIKGNHNNIIGNYITDDYVGINLNEGSSYNFIVDNNIHNGIGAERSCRFNTIIHNNISGWISSTANVDDWVISNNHLNGGGINMQGCENVTITRNEINNAGLAIQTSGDQHFIISSNIVHKGELQISGSYFTVINNTIDNVSYGIEYDEVAFGNCSFNKVTGCSYGLIITLPGESNFIFKNEFRNNNVGVYTLIEYGAVKIKCNNFINNSRDITFGQLFPIHRQTPINPIFNKNYYDNWKGTGPMVLWGRSVIFAIPFLYFPILITIPGIYCDWHPAQKPYDIPGLT